MGGYPKARNCSVQNPSFRLALSWSVGFLFGWFAAMIWFNYFMKSISGLLFGSSGTFVFYLPTFLVFSISALAVYFSFPKLLLFICAMKAFWFGFCGFGICFVYLQCSWLVRLLLMFNDICSLPVLYLYWIRSLCSSKGLSFGTHICFSALLICIGAVDFVIIAPLAEHLFLT